MLPGRSLENTLSRLPLSRWSSPSDRFHAFSRTPPRNAEGGRIASSPDSPSTIVSRPSAYGVVSALLLLTAGPHRLDRHPQQPADQFTLPFGELDLPLSETGRQRGTAYLHEVGPLFLVQLDPHAGTLEHRAALTGGVLLQPAPVQVADQRAEVGDMAGGAVDLLQQRLVGSDVAG